MGQPTGEYPSGGDRNETARAMLERFGGKSREEQMELVLHMALIQVVSDMGEGELPSVSREMIDRSLMEAYDIKEAGGLELNILDYLVALLGGDDKKDVRMSAPALVEAAQTTGREDGEAAGLPEGYFSTMSLPKARAALGRKIRRFHRIPSDMATSMARSYVESYKEAAERVSPN